MARSSKVLASFTGAEMMKNGALTIAQDAELSMDNVAELASVGIGLDAAVEGVHDAFGAVFAQDSVAVGPAIGMSGINSQFLRKFLPGTVHQVTQVRKADEIMGMVVAGDWLDEEIVQRFSVMTGDPQLYGDHANIPLANFTASWERRDVAVFELGFEVMKREAGQATKEGYDIANEKRAATMNALEITRNNVAFSGYAYPTKKIYGFLNDPNLPAYSSVAAGTAGNTWALKTYAEIYSDFLTAVTDLVTKSGGNVTRQSAMTMTIPTSEAQYLYKQNDLGTQTVIDQVMKTFPNLRIVDAPELQGANGGSNVFYLALDRHVDTSTDDGSVISQLVTSRIMALGSDTGMKGYREGYATAVAGALAKRPMFIVRYSGI